MPADAGAGAAERRPPDEEREHPRSCQAIERRAAPGESRSSSAEWGPEDTVSRADRRRPQPGSSPAHLPGGRGPGRQPGKGETAVGGRGALRPLRPALSPRVLGLLGARVGRMCPASALSRPPRPPHPWRGPLALLAGTAQRPSCPQALLFQEF